MSAVCSDLNDSEKVSGNRVSAINFRKMRTNSCDDFIGIVGGLEIECSCRPGIRLQNISRREYMTRTAANCTKMNNACAKHINSCFSLLNMQICDVFFTVA